MVRQPTGADEVVVVDVALGPLGGQVGTRGDGAVGVGGAAAVEGGGQIARRVRERSRRRGIGRLEDVVDRRFGEIVSIRSISWTVGLGR